MLTWVACACSSPSCYIFCGLHTARPHLRRLIKLRFTGSRKPHVRNPLPPSTQAYLGMAVRSALGPGAADAAGACLCAVGACGRSDVCLYQSSDNTAVHQFHDHSPAARSQAALWRPTKGG